MDRTPIPYDSRLVLALRRRHEDVRLERQAWRIAQETGVLAPAPTAVAATAAGDERRLRGIPICAPGVRGTLPGTDPIAELIRIM